MKKIVWGILFIAAAVLIILSSLDVGLGFIGLLPVSNIILGVVVIVISVIFISEGSWNKLPFSAAILFFIFENEIAESIGMESTNIISNWVVLLCAVLLSIGISFIISPIKRKTRKYDKNGYSAKFQDDVKYFDCASLKKEYYMLLMSNGEVAFENVDKYQGGGTLTINCKLSNMTINVPSNWNVAQNIVCVLGETEIPQHVVPDGPTFVIEGKVTLGKVEINYC